MENFKADPLDFFPLEVFERIIQHLPGADLITTTLLNSSWNEVISSSKVFKDKVILKLSCSCEELSNKTLNVIRTSERKYENLHVECCYFCLEKSYPFLITQQFTYVYMERISFMSSYQAVEFFSKIERNIEVLEMCEVYVKFAYFDGKDKGLKFPNLKALRARNVQSFLYYDIFNNLNTLELFRIACNDLNIASLNILLKFIELNRNLKIFETSGRVFRQLFFSFSTTFYDLAEKSSFKLQRLAIDDHDYVNDRFYEQVYKNVAKFIKKNAETLEEIEIDDWMGEDVFMEIMRAPKLKTFSMKGQQLPSLKIDWDSFELFKNPSIKSLNIPTYDLKFVKKVFPNLPNLQSLECSYVNEDVEGVLSEHSKKLEDLSIEFLIIKDFAQHPFLINMKSLFVKNFISNMENVPYNWRL